MHLLKKYDLNSIKENFTGEFPNYSNLLKKIENNKKVIIICGPTCTGKSKIAINLASIFKTDVVSVDSMQIYKGMDIGTDKYNVNKYNIKQHMIDIFDPDHCVTVVEFRDICRNIIKNEYFSKKKIPILVGGSGLYIRGVVDDLEFIPESNEAIRSKLKNNIKKYGLLKYCEELKNIDPIYSSIISENDERRIIRALEVYKITGKPFSSFQSKWKNRKSIYDCIFIGIKTEKNKLYKNIDERVDKMFDMGLVEEVIALVRKGYGDCYSLKQAVGYKEVLEFLKGSINIDQCIQKVKKNTKKLAKKQMTWFKSDNRIKWITADNYDNILDLIKYILVIIESSNENDKN